MDLSYLGDVVGRTGPFATVLLDTSRDSEDAAHAIELRWRALRKTLEEEGADEATLSALDEVVGSDLGIAGRHGQAIVAAEGEVLLVEALPGPPRREIARWSALPHLMPVVVQRTELVPHVLVVADRLGADVSVFGPGTEATLTVTGEEYPVRKVHGGGWSHRRFQQRAENLWEQNARQVAELVDRLVESTGARLVVAAGDVRAVTALRENVGQRALDMLTVVEEGGRGAGAAEEPLDEAVAQLCARILAEDLATTIDRFRREAGQHDLAVQGMAATVEAVRKAQVDTLVLNDHPESTARLWTGRAPHTLGMSREEVAALGEAEPFEERADAVLVRALVATGAHLAVVPEAEVELADGVGAILRYHDASTPDTT